MDNKDVLCTASQNKLWVYTYIKTFPYTFLKPAFAVMFTERTPDKTPYTFRGRIRDKRVREKDYQLKYAIFSTACSIVYKYCTRPISKHLYSGIFKDPLYTKHKIFKKKTEFINVMFHV